MDPWWKRPSPSERDDDKAYRQQDSKDDGPAALSGAAAEEELEPYVEAEEEKNEAEEDQPSRGPRRSRGKRSRGRRRRASSGADPATAPAARRATAVAGVASAIFCDVERFARALRHAEVGVEEAPELFAALFPQEGAAIRRAYTSGNRHTRLQQMLGDFGFVRVEVDGGGHSLRVRLALDALDLAHTEEPPQRFVILAGDDALLPLTERLRERGCQVLCLDGEGELANSGDGIFSLDPGGGPAIAEDGSEEGDDLGDDESQDGVFDQLLLAVAAVAQAPPQLIWGTTVLQRMQEENPRFSERSGGFESFDGLLEEAARQGLVRVRRDPRSDTYLITAYRSIA